MIQQENYIGTAGVKKPMRIYLVVADETEELGAALRFASSLAKGRGARLGVLYTYSEDEFTHWGRIEAMIQAENRLKAENFVLSIAARIFDYCGSAPAIFLEQGKASDAIINVINNNPDIVRLILGGNTKAGDPGPLINYFASKGLEKLNVPLTIVPDTLSEDRFGD